MTEIVRLVRLAVFNCWLPAWLLISRHLSTMQGRSGAVLCVCLITDLCSGIPREL